MNAQVKICGITRPYQVTACTAAGADAIGFVFHPESPRYVSAEIARVLSRRVPTHVVPVGVFVDQSGEQIVEIARTAMLRTVQLHGVIMPDTAPIRAAGLRIVRVLFDLKPPDPLPDADAFLIECGRGPLPGGNGTPWDWEAAAVLIAELPRPCGLAGGLNPENVGEALRATGAAAVDTSSGVESCPGLKDVNLVRSFIDAVRRVTIRAEQHVF